MQGGITIAVVGLGYWGPNRLRVLSEARDVDVKYICDIDGARLERAAQRFPLASPTPEFEQVIADDSVDAVVISTPAASHFELTSRALEQGKHVFVEKPLATNSQDARRLAEAAADRAVVLMCGHTFLYSPAVRKVKDLIDAGELGDIYFVSSRRVNLGPYRSDVNVLWDLGAHDFSILLYWLGQPASWVSAAGRDVIAPGIADVGFVHVAFPDGILSHVELSWLAPNKLRQTVIVGSKKMLVYEDGTADPVKVVDNGIEYRDPQSYGEYHLSYRTGDVLSPHIAATEPIVAELAGFIGAVKGSSRPESTPALAIETIRLIEAAQTSMGQGGVPVALAPSATVEPHRR